MSSGALPSLDQAPYVELTDDQLRAVIDRFRLGVSIDDVSRLPSIGVAHTIYAVGSDLVLRVPKAHPDAIADVYTGMIATPVARAAGVSAPELAAFDDSLEIVPLPFSVYERADGEALHLQLGAEPSEFESVWRDLGRELATLHANVRECADPDGRLDDHDRLDDHRRLIESLQADGFLNRDASAWFSEILDRLRPSIAPDPGYRRFVHGDVTPSNVLVNDRRYRALIDWDDAGWADPVVDFRGLPLRVVDAVLAGYRTVNPIDGDDTAESRILWDKLVGALGRLRLEPRPPTSPTSPAPAARLIELFAAAVDGADSPIMQLLRR